MTRLNIAVVAAPDHDSAGPGRSVSGGDRARVAHLPAALARRGHHVRVYQHPDAAAGRVPVGVRVDHIPASVCTAASTPVSDEVGPAFAAALAEWLVGRWRDDGFSPDVLHAQNLASGWAGHVVRQQTSCPLVLSASALPGLVALARVADRVVVRCAEQSRRLRQAGVARDAIVRVPDGVDVEAFTPAGPLTLAPPSRPRIVCLGPVDQAAGFVDVLHALVAVPDAELVLAGSADNDRRFGEEHADAVAARLRALAVELGVAGRVRLTRARSEASRAGIYRGAHVVACASDQPWSAAVALEAMACGVAVVGYAGPDARDIIIDGVTGDLVAPGDVRALGVSLRRFLADDVRRMSCACAGSDRARSRYDWARLAGEVERVYVQVAGVAEEPAAGRAEEGAEEGAEDGACGGAGDRAH